MIGGKFYTQIFSNYITEITPRQPNPYNSNFTKTVLLLLLTNMNTHTHKNTHTNTDTNTHHHDQPLQKLSSCNIPPRGGKLMTFFLRLR